MYIPFYILVLIFGVIAYLIGSIPTGYIIVKLKTGQDIREIGSGSTGATNVKRVLGKKWFFIVMLLDAIKGFLPVFLAWLLISGDIYGIVNLVCAVMVIVGHSKPIFLGFRGGKSVATGIGTIFALNPLAGVILAVIWSVITWFSRYVSLGSIVTLCCAPFLMYYLHNPIGDVVYVAIAAVYIVYLHRQNIVRLIQGVENKVR